MIIKIALFALIQNITVILTFCVEGPPRLSNNTPKLGLVDVVSFRSCDCDNVDKDVDFAILYVIGLNGNRYAVIFEMIKNSVQIIDTNIIFNCLPPVTEERMLI